MGTGAIDVDVIDADALAASLRPTKERSVVNRAAIGVWQVRHHDLMGFFTILPLAPLIDPTITPFVLCLVILA